MAVADQDEVAAERVARALVPEPDLFGHAEFLGLPPMPVAQGAAIERRRPGRPPGARNRRAEDVARFAIERFGDPLLRQVAIATMPVDELAARLGCSVFEAAQEQRLSALAVLPYLHRRQPQAVDLSASGAVSLTINLGDGGVGAAAASAGIVAVASGQYQYVSEGEGDAV